MSLCVDCGERPRVYPRAVCTPCRRARARIRHAERVVVDPAYAERKRLAARANRKPRKPIDQERERHYNAKPYRKAARRAYKAKTWIAERVRKRVRAAVLQHEKRGAVVASADRRLDYDGIIRHLGPCPGDPSDYEIDHIRPLASFDLADPAQFSAAFAPSNHQWLTRTENRRKWAKEGG